MSELVRLLFYCSNYLPSLNYCLKKEEESGHNSGKDKLKS